MEGRYHRGDRYKTDSDTNLTKAAGAKTLDRRVDPAATVTEGLPLGERRLGGKDEHFATEGQQLTFKPSPVVAERFRALGRTEDVMFSPDQTRLAIAGFNENKVLVLGIEVVTDDGVLSVQSDACVELRCKDFSNPHGLAWLDDGTLIVANRGKDVIAVSVPVASSTGEVVVPLAVTFSTLAIVIRPPRSLPAGSATRRMAAPSTPGNA